MVIWHRFHLEEQAPIALVFERKLEIRTLWWVNIVARKIISTRCFINQRIYSGKEKKNKNKVATQSTHKANRMHALACARRWKGAFIDEKRKLMEGEVRAVELCYNRRAPPAGFSPAGFP